MANQPSGGLDFLWMLTVAKAK